MDTITTRAWIGIDVSKPTLDVCVLRTEGKPQHRKFLNDASEFPKSLHTCALKKTFRMLSCFLLFTGVA